MTKEEGQKLEMTNKRCEELQRQESESGKVRV